MPFRSPKRAVSLLVLSLVPLSAISVSGCSKLGLFKKTAAAPTPAPAPVKKMPEAPKIDYAAIRPNEVGVIPVIMYHEVKGTVNSPAKLLRSVASFKQDLELLYKNNFIPVNMGDVVNNNINIPAGKSPCVLTFDDARQSQFRLIETPTALKIDPESAMGVMEAFSKAHPDWPMRATFFVLPRSKVTLDPFGQAGMGNDKFAYIIKQGMEIGNHSTFHKSFRNMTPDQIQAEVGNAHKEIMAAVPDAKVQVLALPMGQFPRNKANLPYLLKGSYQGTKYEYKAVMDAAWRPTYSPSAKQYNPLRLERIDSVEGLNGVRDWITKLSSGGSTMARYISDGDPNVISYPKGNERDVNVALIKAEGKLANSYSPFGTGSGSKPIIGSAPTKPIRIIDPSKPEEPETTITAEYGSAESAVKPAESPRSGG